MKSTVNTVSAALSCTVVAVEIEIEIKSEMVLENRSPLAALSDVMVNVAFASLAFAFIVNLWVGRRLGGPDHGFHWFVRHQYTCYRSNNIYLEEPGIS
jgi:hypothetical protein